MLRTGSSDRLSCNRLQPPESINRYDRFLNDIPTHKPTGGKRYTHTMRELIKQKSPGQPGATTTRIRCDLERHKHDLHSLRYLLSSNFISNDRKHETHKQRNQSNQPIAKTKKPSVIQGQILK